MTAPRQAFTLIELVAALVLASIMMVALLRIVTVIAGETNQLRREQTDRVAAGVLADRVREDWINGRGMRVNARSITLAGFVTGEGVPGVIEYRTERVGTDDVLIRREGQRSELVWVGFGGLSVEPLEFEDEDPVAPKSAGGLQPIPSQFRISASDTSGRILFREVVHHHAR